MEDVLFEIALRCKIPTIIHLMRVLPKLNTDYFWKQKCLRDYPTKYYLDFWTGVENYLMGNHKFCFHMYMNNHSEITGTDQYLYEYTPSFSLMCDVTNCHLSIAIISDIKQFVVIWDEEISYDTSCYHTHEHMMRSVEKYPEKTAAIVIDLKYRSPCFLKYGVIKWRDVKKTQRYYLLNGKII